MKGTSLYIFKGGNVFEEHFMPPEQVNRLLSGEEKVPFDVIGIVEVLAETQLYHFDFYPDARVPDEALKEIGFEPYHKKGH